MRLYVAFFLLFTTSCALFQLTSRSFIANEPNISVKSNIHELSNERQRFALIIGLNAEERHRGNISLAYQVLLESGYKRNNIFILDISTSGPFFPKTETTSFASFQKIVSILVNVVGQEDDIIIYVTGHGDVINGIPYMNLNPSERIEPREFLASLSMINAGQALLFVDQCYWIEQLPPPRCNWTVISVSTQSSTSHGVGFPRLFWSSFRNDITTAQDAFTYALLNDVSTQFGENIPSFNGRWCGGDIRNNDLIQF
jgi:hypothetical protein